MKISSDDLKADLYLTEANWHDALGTMYQIEAEVIAKDANLVDAALIGLRYTIEFGEGAAARVVSQTFGSALRLVATWSK